MRPSTTHHNGDPMSNDTEAGNSLLAHTRELLRKTQRPYLDIYSDTGLSPNWLSQMLHGRIKEPSVNKVQKLYEYLSGKSLLN